MKNHVNPSHDRVIRFEDVEWGVAAGLWYVAEDGHEWRDDLSVVSMRPQPGDHIDPGPWLVPQGQVARRYGVFRRAGLLDSFARLAQDPVPPKIKTFADRFGLLGRDSFLLPAGARSGRLDTIGESLGTWVTALLAFRDIWTLWNAVVVLRDEDAQSPSGVRAARDVLAERITLGDDRTALYSSVQRGPGGSRVETHHRVESPGRDDGAVVDPVRRSRAAETALLVSFAGFYAARQVNERIEGMRPHVLPLRDYSIRYSPDTLETAVWFSLALVMSGETGRQVSCEHCQTLFQKTRSNRRFCSAACQASARYHRVLGSRPPVRGRYLDTGDGR